MPTQDVLKTSLKRLIIDWSVISCHPFNIMIVLKTYFVRYECLSDVFCMLWMSLKMSFVCYECLKDVFCTLWMSQRRPLYVMNVLKTPSVRYKCLYMNFSKTSFVTNVYKTLWTYLFYNFRWKSFIKYFILHCTLHQTNSFIHWKFIQTRKSCERVFSWYKRFTR